MQRSKPLVSHPKGVCSQAILQINCFFPCSRNGILLCQAHTLLLLPRFKNCFSAATKTTTQNKARRKETRMCYLERMIHTCGHNVTCWHWCCSQKPGIKCKKGIGMQQGFITNRGYPTELGTLCAECTIRRAQAEEPEAKSKGKGRAY